MTIRRDEDWGREVERPPDLRIAVDDAALARAVTDGSGRATAVSGGDMYRTLGATPIGSRSTLRELPLDLLRVGLVDGTQVDAAAHVVVRRPRFRGSWWRGEVLLVMNAQFHGQLDLAPRGHPNDGFADALWCTGRLPARQRWLAARRARQAAHLPHPEIEASRIRCRTWSFDKPMLVIVDDVFVGSGDTVSVEVRADAATVFI